MVDVWVLGSGSFVPPGVGVHKVKAMICASVKIACTHCSFIGLLKIGIVVITGGPFI